MESVRVIEVEEWIEDVRFGTCSEQELFDRLERAEVGAVEELDLLHESISELKVSNGCLHFLLDCYETSLTGFFGLLSESIWSDAVLANAVNLLRRADANLAELQNQLTLMNKKQLSFCC